MKLSLFLGLATSMGLSACAALTNIENLGNTPVPSLKTIYEARAAYDAAFLAPARAYKNLPRCAAGVVFTIKAPCSSAAIIVKLQQVDKIAEADLDGVEAYARAHPGDAGITTLYNAAITAVAQAEAIMTPYVVAS